MTNLISNIIVKHKKIIKYMLCSLTTLFSETIVGWILLQYFIRNIVISNMIALLLGAAIHYHITLYYVFKREHSSKTLIAYLITFTFGFSLQNCMIWISYYFILNRWSYIWRFFVSKAISVILTFFSSYYLRIQLNKKLIDFKVK